MPAQDDELSPDEAAAYRALDERSSPSAELEERVVRDLHARGLLRAARARGLTWAVAALVAAAAAFPVGVLVGRAAAPAPSASAAASPRFVLLLEQADGRPALGAEAERVREYVAWAREQRAAGRLIGGEKLRDEAVVLEGTAATRLSSVPELGGYFIVTAPDLERALEIARSCPHLRHGGRVTLRPIAELS